MNVAVLSLTRDRLDYTKHCFASLRENAGCRFDHYVLDQGSDDETNDWLGEALNFAEVYSAYGLWRNIGVNRGLNCLLDSLDDAYDVIVKFDNDCELTEPNTLRDVCRFVLAGDAILSPRILGLINPPVPIGEFEISGEPCLEFSHIGGIFLAAPAWVYEEFRHREDAPLWGSDDVDICHWFRAQGGRCGYVQRLTANHYETTRGQHERYPDYFERKDREFATA